MKNNLKYYLKLIKNVIEELWSVVAILWNLPIAIIEIIWEALFDRERLKANWNYIKGSIKGKKSEKNGTEL